MLNFEMKHKSRKNELYLVVCKFAESKFDFLYYRNHNK